MKKKEIRNLAFSKSDLKGVDLAYHDGELVLVDSIHEAPDFSSCKLRLHVIVMCQQGWLRLGVGGLTVTLVPRHLLVIASQSVCTDISLSDDFACKVMCISDRLLGHLLPAEYPAWTRVLASRECFVVPCTPAASSIYEEIVIRRKRSAVGPYHREILLSLIRAGLLAVLGSFRETDAAPTAGTEADATSRVDSIFRQFLLDLQQREVKKTSVQECAEKLCITPGYLSKVCLQASGKPAKDWISEFLAEEIAGQLRYTELSVKEIAERTGFPNTSFFSKFVRSHLGFSPTEYRLRTEAGEDVSQSRT